MEEVELPYIIETISQHTNWKFITVRKLRKMLGIESEDAKTIRKLSKALVWLAHYGFLEEVEDRNPKLYRIQSEFPAKTRDIVRIYKKLTY